MKNGFTNIRAVIKAYANALNLLTPDVDMYHQKVAYLSDKIAEDMGYSVDDRQELIYCALMHDVGLALLPEKKDYVPGIKELALAGAGLVGDVKIIGFMRDFFAAAKNEDGGTSEGTTKYDVFVDIVKIAREVARLLSPKDAALNQTTEICDSVSELDGDSVSPEVIEHFLKVAEKEYIWLELLHQPEICMQSLSDRNDITLDETIELARFMSRIIDFRSSYTAMHSSGVAASAVRLAEILGMSEDECKMMMIAGYLHDIGKLKVPKSILDKNDKLTDEEFNLVKEYAYYTHLILKDIDGFEQIGRWAALHHEKLNGYGYPFGLSADDIPMGARIIAIADSFSAVAEIRPYRRGMAKEEVIQILNENSESGAMSGYIIDLMINNYDEIHAIRDTEVSKEGARYYASVVDAEED